MFFVKETFLERLDACRSRPCRHRVFLKSGLCRTGCPSPPGSQPQSYRAVDDAAASRVPFAVPRHLFSGGKSSSPRCAAPTGGPGAWNRPGSSRNGRHARSRPQFLPTIVDYNGKHKPGTIVIDTNARFLYLVQSDGTARRYGVGVGKPGL